LKDFVQGKNRIDDKLHVYICYTQEVDTRAAKIQNDENEMIPITKIELHLQMI